MSAPLASITVAGFRSIESITLDLSSAVTLLIGANGAGKSNIVDAFELLGYTVDGKLGDHVLRSGGFAQLLHRSVGPASAESIVIDAWGGWNGPYRNGYRMRLTPGPDDAGLLNETTYMQEDGYDQPYGTELGLSRESRLAAVARDHPANNYLLDIMSGCRVFHFDDTSPSAPPLRFVDVSDSDTLHSDARNLAAVLLDMKLNHLARYEQVRRSVRNVAPFFDDFVLKPEGGRVLLRWSERGLDGVFSGAALSSGTLRFACLAVLLQQPSPPATIVLDEPELGLHPAAIHQLADLMRRTEAGRRIVAATQSVTLLGQFTLADIAVVERDDGSTVVHRPDREILEVWLADYSVGELWEMNLLGGRPGSKVTVARTSAA